MKGIFKFNTDINTLWDYIEDFEKQKLWQLWSPGMVSKEVLTQMDSSKPNPFIIKIQAGKNLKDINCYMPIYDPKTQMTIVSDAGEVQMTTIYKLSQNGDITTLEFEMHTLCRPILFKIIFGAVVIPLFGKMMVKKSMNILKKLVEKNN